jgi:hypothetical protein
MHLPLFNHAGYEDGYPVFISNDLDQARSLSYLTYLDDGAYLSSALTEYMTLEAVVSRADWMCRAGVVSVDVKDRQW